MIGVLVTASMQQRLLEVALLRGFGMGSTAVVIMWFYAFLPENVLHARPSF